MVLHLTLESVEFLPKIFLEILKREPPKNSTCDYSILKSCKITDNYKRKLLWNQRFSTFLKLPEILLIIFQKLPQYKGMYLFLLPSLVN